MNLNEAKAILKKHGYVLTESDNFNKFDKKLYQNSHYDMNLKTLGKNSTKIDDIFSTRPGFNPLENSSDQLGKKWLGVKKHDYTTIALACIDGLCDGQYIHEYVDTLPQSKKKKPKNEDDYWQLDDEAEKEYNMQINIYKLYSKITSQRYLNQVLKLNPKLKKYIDDMYSFLAKYFSGTHKVYRGISVPFTKKICDYLYEAFTNSSSMSIYRQLTDMFSNTAKNFSSFTTSRAVAGRFALSRSTYHNSLNLLIEGEAYANIIAFPMTAYLSAKFNSTNQGGRGDEFELTLNNVSGLKNINLVDAIDDYNLKQVHSNKNITMNAIKTIAKSDLPADTYVYAYAYAYRDSPYPYNYVLTREADNKKYVLLFANKPNTYLYDEWKEMVCVTRNVNEVPLSLIGIKQPNRKFKLYAPVVNKITEEEFDYISTTGAARLNGEDGHIDYAGRFTLDSNSFSYIELHFVSVN